MPQAPKYRPMIGMDMKIMDQGSGRGLAMAMSATMPTTAHRQPRRRVRPLTSPNWLIATRTSGSRKVRPKTRMIRVTKER